MIIVKNISIFPSNYAKCFTVLPSNSILIVFGSLCLFSALVFLKVFFLFHTFAERRNIKSDKKRHKKTSPENLPQLVTKIVTYLLTQSSKISNFVKF